MPIDVLGALLSLGEFSKACPIVKKEGIDIKNWIYTKGLDSILNVVFDANIISKGTKQDTCHHLILSYIPCRCINALMKLSATRYSLVTLKYVISVVCTWH